MSKYNLLVINTKKSHWCILMCDHKNTLHNIRTNIYKYFPYHFTKLVDPDAFMVTKYVYPKGKRVSTFVREILTRTGEQS